MRIAKAVVLMEGMRNSNNPLPSKVHKHPESNDNLSLFPNVIEVNRVPFEI